MSHTKRTLALSEDWDLEMTPEGNLRVLSGARATAQNAANEIRLWTNDAYFQQENGISWKEVELAQKLDASTLEQVVREAAMRVPDVVQVTDVELETVDTKTRRLSGTVSVRTTEDETATQDF